jgi:hypothetical protein
MERNTLFFLEFAERRGTATTGTPNKKNAFKRVESEPTCGQGQFNV